MKEGYVVYFPHDICRLPALTMSHFLLHICYQQTIQKERLPRILPGKHFFVQFRVVAHLFK